MVAVAEYLALTHEQRLELLVTVEGQKAALAAEEQVLLHAIVLGASDVELDSGRSDRSVRDREWVDEEIACVLRISPRTAGGRRAIAEHLVTVLPDTLDALAQGRISFPHALRLCEATSPLDDDVACQVEAAVLGKAERQTPGQFAASTRKAVARLDTRKQEQRHADAKAQRRAVVTPQPDGMADLWAHLPAECAAAIWDQVHRCADLTDGADERTADQRRADALIDLILDPPTPHPTGAVRAGVRPSVHVTVALSTLLGLDEQGGELAGHGPIPPALARVLAFDPNGTWRRILTNDTGRILDTSNAVSRRTYRPGAALDRTVRLRDQTCRFPGCRTSAHQSELDHIIAWADGGPTTAENLQALCVRHHHLKHETQWRVRRRPDGTTSWTSPDGRRYTQPPPDPLPIDTTMTAMIDEPAPF